MFNLRKPKLSIDLYSHFLVARPLKEVSTEITGSDVPFITLTRALPLTEPTVPAVEEAKIVHAAPLPVVL